MRLEVEKRLHRVAIVLDKKDIVCPNAKQCDKAENCDRCNKFFEKCSIFKNSSK